MSVTVLADGASFPHVSCRKDGTDLCYIVSSRHISKDTKLLTLDLALLSAQVGDSGYYVIPDGKVSFLTRFIPRKDTEYIVQGRLMNMVGAKFAQQAYLVIVEGMRYEYSLRLIVQQGKYSLRLRYNLEAFSMYEDIRIRIVTIEDPDATYVDIAKAYRRYVAAQKGLVSLAQRAKNDPVLAYGAVDMPIIRVRMGWKPAPSPVADQTPETEPPMHVACTFDQVGLLLDEMKVQGLEKAEICLVGWNIRGHDGRWPQTFPVEPALGGEDGLRRLIAHASQLGYRISCHTNSSEAYRIAECFDETDMVQKKDGSISINTDVWSGGRAYHLCPKVACDKFLPHTLARVKELGFRGFHYIDVITIVGPKTCYNPLHPSTGAESAGYVNAMLQQAREAIGGSGSEGAYDFAAQSLDFALYTVFNSITGMPALADQPIPLWQLVYHGYVLSNPSSETVNYMIKKPANRLRFYEYGGVPVAYYFTCFVGANSVGDWMGSEDLYCDTEEHRRSSVQKLKAAMDEYHPFAPLQLAFMDDHRQLAEGVYETVYSDGHHTVVNYTDKDYPLGGRIVPAQDVLLFRAN